MTEFEVQVQICNLCDSLLRNINDNFKNVSFDILGNGNIQVKIILENQSEEEDEYIDDISAEFSATQESNIVEKFEVVTDNTEPRTYIVYNRE
jgi:hypothetical protein